MNLVRAFVAAPLPTELAAPLQQLQTTLAAQVSGFRPMPLANLHLTLVFLGDQSTQTLEEIAALMLSVGGRTRPFAAPFRDLQLAGRGHHRRPLCLEIAPVAQLIELQRRLSRRIARLGIEPERRRYWPHLSLGRTTPPLLPPEQRQRLLASAPRQIRIERVCLYSSHLQPGGAQHEVLATAEFTGE